MDLTIKAMMAFTFLNGAILSIDLFYNIFHALFPL
jgi:hypothetical protein